VKTSTYGKVLDVFRDISIPIGAASSAANLANSWYFWSQRWNDNNNNN